MAIKVKSFGIEIRPMKTMQELHQLDEAVNTFLAGSKIKNVISVSDIATADDSGETIGMIRVVTYQE